jgi:hypothetical protein
VIFRGRSDCGFRSARLFAFVFRRFGAFKLRFVLVCLRFRLPCTFRFRHRGSSGHGWTCSGHEVIAGCW